jgi:hypothetical protein
MTTAIVFILVLVITGLFLVKYAAKLVFKILGFIFFIIALFITLYMLNIGPWSDNILSRKSLEKKFCNSNADAQLCDCVVQPYVQILETKFLEDELREIENSNYESAYIYTKLYGELKSYVALCVGNADSAESLLNTFQNELIPVGNYAKKALDMITDKASEMQHQTERKKELDEKLNNVEI